MLGVEHRHTGPRFKVTSSHSSVITVLDLKTRGCGFDSRAGQPNNYLLSFRLDFKPRSRVTVLYAENIKEPGGALSSFVLYPCTVLRPIDN